MFSVDLANSPINNNGFVGSLVTPEDKKLYAFNHVPSSKKDVRNERYYLS